MPRTKFSGPRDQLMAKPGVAEKLADARRETPEEIRLSKLEHSDDVRVSTLRQYLEGLGARLELVAVVDEDERRVPVPPRERLSGLSSTKPPAPP